MKIEISKLNQTKGGTDFSYNDRAEDAIINAVSYYHELQSNGGTTGFDPRYDKILNRSKIEIKVTGSTGIYIEILKGNGDLSGIFTTESDLYLVVKPGMDKGLKCVKAILFRTAEIRHWMEYMIDKHPEKMKTYKADSMGPGSSGYMLDINHFDDLYILGFNYVGSPDSKVFDTFDVVLPSAYANSNIRKYIP